MTEPEQMQRPRLTMLSQEQIERLHRASLTILQRTGVEFHLPEVVTLLRRAGADVEGERRVRIPSHLVEEALRLAPKGLSLYGRNGEAALHLEGHNTYFGTGSDTPHILDPLSDERRPAVKADVARMARLCDALPNIDFVMSMGLAGDVPKATSDRHHFEAMVSSTTKPIVFTAWGLDGLRDIHEMCALVAGSSAGFRERPFAALYFEPISPLVHPSETCEQLLFCADQGIPTIYISGPLLGAMSPVTSAGTIALVNAEFLSGLVVAQLRSPGAPVIYGGGIAAMDMRTTIPAYGGPEVYRNYAILRELADYYGLPIFGTGGCSDAKRVDQQAALEATHTLLIAGLAGNNLIHDVGYLDSGLTSSPEMLVLCDEIISLVKWYQQGMEISDETLALDLIDQLGPGQDFLSSEHTLQHFREAAWYPRLLNRQNHDGWVQSGSHDLGHTLKEETRTLWEKGSPAEPLAESVQEALREVVERADSVG